MRMDGVSTATSTLEARMRRVFLERLMDWGALPKTRSCPAENCRSEMKLMADTRFCDGVSWYCSAVIPKKNGKRIPCQNRLSIRMRTFFEGSHLTLEQIILIVRGWSKNTPQKEIANKISVSKNTLIVWSSVCRDVATDYCLSHSKLIGGPDKTVDIDLLHGKKKYDTVQYLMLGGVERESGNYFLAIVNERKTGKILAAMKQWIEPNTNVVSDLFKEFSLLSNEGTKKWKTDYRVNFIDPLETAAVKAEGTWWYTKRRTPCKKREDCLAGYFAQYMFLNKCRIDDIDPLIEFLRAENKFYDLDQVSSDTMGRKLSTEEIETRLKEQDDVVCRTVENAKTDDEMRPSLEALLQMKADYKIAIGEDWKGRSDEIEIPISSEVAYKNNTNYIEENSMNIKDEISDPD